VVAADGGLGSAVADSSEEATAAGASGGGWEVDATGAAPVGTGGWKVDSTGAASAGIGSGAWRAGATGAAPVLAGVDRGGFGGVAVPESV